ncbi:MAG: CoA-binding protein [Bacteroidales bacterium]|nr:CoA-binding protein [Bacteroidales bacterium]MBN2819423.1 CoA-binding protein [Bacteroidales bacterium]
MEKYLVLGASPNPLRHSYKAVKSLIRHGKAVVPVGFRKGSIGGEEILKGKPELDRITTLLLYLGEKRQKEFYKYILETIVPTKLVFNPGTENSELKELAVKQGINVIDGCALVMINSGQL